MQLKSLRPEREPGLGTPFFVLKKGQMLLGTLQLRRVSVPEADHSLY